ncbi:MAG: hypothetical protein LUC31_03710 [Coprobacillus sp.]|nr:hypothetical protein [Coprobacillus sp.]
MKILLLGASGSIGTQTRDVILKHHDKYQVVGVSLGSKDIVKQIISEFPEIESIYLTDGGLAKKYQERYPHVAFYSEQEGIETFITNADYDMMVNALSGFFGLLPSILALKSDKKLALANKESIVCGGDLLKPLLTKGKGVIYPIDSEHSAICRCLKAEPDNIKKVWLTTSGGALYSLSEEELDKVTPAQALKHPNWNMGKLITAESALMVNKAYEVAEACFLFNFEPTQIEVVVDKASFVHSAIEYSDGHIRAYTHKPSMEQPIEFALEECESIDPNYETKTYSQASLKLEPLDEESYPLFRYFESIIHFGSVFGTVFNASVETLIQSFLEKHIKYTDITAIIEYLFQNMPKNPMKVTNYEQLLEIDHKVRDRVKEVINKW